MTSIWKYSAVFLLCALLATGCSGVKKRDAGAVIGGVAGGVAGAAIGGSNPTVAAIATIAGVLIGVGVGAYVGGKFDDADKVHAAEILEGNKDNAAGAWRNPNSGARYSVTPVRTFKDEAGEDCRDYSQVVEIDGKSEQVSGTACRVGGRWQIVAAQ